MKLNEPALASSSYRNIVMDRSASLKGTSLIFRNNPHILIRMMRIVLLLAFVGMMTPHVIGESIRIDHSLKKPDTIPALQQPHSTLIPLQEAIKADNLEEFYEAFGKILQSHDSNKTDPDSININIWLLYYAAAAPLYAPNYDDRDNNWLITNRTKDIDTKSKTVLHIRDFMSTLTDKTCRAGGYKKADITALTSLYLSRIVLSLRTSYDPDITSTQKRIKESYNKKIEQEVKNSPAPEGTAMAHIEAMERRLRVFSNKLVRNENRNIWIKVQLQSMEKPFVEMLTANYPRQDRQVYQYIRMAGYEGDEAGELIDRYGEPISIK